MTSDFDKSDRESSSAPPDDAAVLRLGTEELSVSKEKVQTGRVRVSTVTHEHEQLVDELLTHDRADIHREPVGKYVDTMPKVRTEGDVTIIPIVEEVIERRLLLKEEIRVQRVRDTERYQDRVALHTQEAVINREPADENSS